MDGAKLTDRAASPGIALHGACKARLACRCRPEGSAGSGRAVLAFRLEVGHRHAERRKLGRGNRQGAGRGWQGGHQRRGVTTTGAEMTAVGPGAVVRFGRAFVRQRVVRVGIGVSMCARRVSMRMAAGLGSRVRMACGVSAHLARLCAHHDRADRAPQGQQRADQQQNEDAEGLHKGKLSRGRSCRILEGTAFWTTILNLPLVGESSAAASGLHRRRSWRAA